MKLLIFSDSHGDVERMCAAIDREAPDAICHLGDYVRDAEALKKRYPGLPLYNVRGNCDPADDTPEQLELTLDGVPVFLCHGHRYNVKITNQKLLNAGWFSGAKLVLFGHTHLPVIREYEELTVLNPGTAALSAARVETDGQGGFTAEIFPLKK